MQQTRQVPVSFFGFGFIRSYMLVLSGATSGPVVPSTSGDTTLDLGVARNSENNLIGQTSKQMNFIEFSRIGPPGKQELRLITA